MKQIRVIVVDDSPTIRQLFTAMLSSAPDIRVVDTAEDPYDAREKIRAHNPDVVTLDVEMPKMDGISFLEKIMKLRPMPVVMASTLTKQGADITLRALELGAVDYVTKPKMEDKLSLVAFQEALIQKVRMAARARLSTPKDGQPGGVLHYSGSGHGQLIAIGASTGGVEALREVLVRFPSSTPPIVVTQHMPELFTASFAKRLDGLCAAQVSEAQEGQPVVPGNVYIAPGNQHLEIAQSGSRLVCRLSDGALVSGHRPSVDVMFHSVAKLRGVQVVAAIMTGMGHDGAEGMLALRKAGARTLGQSEASCVVYGMPRAAMELGAVEREWPLGSMAEHILHACMNKGAQHAG